MSKIKREEPVRLGQENPHDQLVSQLGAIEGNILNLEDGHSSPENVAKNIRFILAAMRAVLPHVKGVEWKADETKEFEYSNE